MHKVENEKSVEQVFSNAYPANLPVSQMGEGESCQELQPLVMAETYLKCLFGGINNAYIHLWIKSESGQKSLFFTSNDTENIAKEAISLAKTNDVYLGMGLRRENLGPYKRGGAEDISYITCVYLDIDLASPVHSQVHLPEDIKTVDNILAKLPPYSILVKSGHGVYAIWLLEQPWIIEDETSRKNIQMLLNKYHKAAALLFKSEGYIIDNVSDIARILRMPCTLNHKQEPVLVTYEARDLRYSPVELLMEAEKIITNIDVKVNQPKEKLKVITSSPVTIAADSIVSRCRFLGHCVEDASILTEGDWYFGLVSIIARTDGGREMVHQFSSPYPGYSRRETDFKIDHALSDAGPSTCSGIADKCGGEYCEGCPFKGHISSPIQLGTPAKQPVANAVQAFPVEALPVALRRYAEESSRSIGCPVDFISVFLLVIAGGIIGSTHKVIVKPGWTEYPGLYVAVVASPSSKKSPALRAATVFIDELVQDLNKEYRSAMAEFAIQKDAWEAAMDEWKQDRNQDKPPAPEEPILQRLYTVDTTVEALALIMAQNPAGIGIYRDELSGWYKSLNSYRGGAGSDKEFFLSSYSGAPYIVDRKGKEPIVIEKTSLSITGCITPDVIGELISTSSVADGFLDRLNCVFPDPVEHRWTDFAVNNAVIDATRECFRGLYAIRVQSNPFEPIEISLNDSKGLFRDWYDATYRETEAANFPKVLLGSWGKLPGVCARICLILHLCRMVTEPGIGYSVSTETISDAIAISEYFKDHYRKTYGVQGENKYTYRIEKVLVWVSKHKKKFITARDLQSSRVAGIGKADEAREILTLMEESGLGIWSCEAQGVFIVF